MPKHRILIERLPNDFVQVKLQRKRAIGYKVKIKEVLQPHQADKTNPESTISLLIENWQKMYDLRFKDIIDTRYEYKADSIADRIIIEVKLYMYSYAYKKRLKAARNRAIFLYLSSGVDRHTRGKFWVIQDIKANPVVINAKDIPELKRAGEIGKNASFLDFNNEALFCAHNLSDEALKQEKAYKQFYK